MDNEYNISNIYNALSIYGIDKKFVKKVLLPEWWDDEIANTKAGYLQTISIIAKNLGIDITRWLDSQTLIPKLQYKVKFKTAKNVSLSSNDLWPQSIAIRVNELLKNTFTRKYDVAPADINVIRDDIIRNYDRITLANILDYLWTAGIPVLHVSEFPKGLKKMDGMVIKTEDRPVIILSRNRKHEAWLLFIIAHELGHIAKGHINNKEDVIYDSDIEYEEEDYEEKEATEFALELITKNKNPNFISQPNITAFRLNTLSKNISNELKIDPGVIALNFAFKHKNFPLAEQALKILNPQADAVLLVKEKIRSYLELNRLSEENLDFFMKLTSLSGE